MSPATKPQIFCRNSKSKCHITHVLFPITSIRLKYTYLVIIFIEYIVIELI